MFFIVYSLFFVGSTYGFNPEHRASKSKNFDVLIFTQHWPQTVCFEWKEKSETHDCSLPSDEEWTIHGLWPSQFGTKGPQFCNTSESFNISALSPIENELEVKWLDIEKGQKKHSFWRHEWLKHGTCATVLEVLDNEFKYFQKGLQLLDEYDMKNVLGQTNILPGQSYTAKDILLMIRKILGKNAALECVENPKTHESYIFEVRICFDKTMKLIDCNGIYGFPGNCNLNENIIYPGTTPGFYNVLQF